MANDYFRFQRFTIRQGQCAMKVGTDGTLLGAWALLPAAAETEAPLVLDIGTGTGLIALMMAQRYPQVRVVGIDIDDAAVSQARANVAESPFASRVNIVEGDVVQPDILAGQSFDAIVCNPPFFEDALVCPDDRRTLARHAVTLSFAQLMGRARQLLTDGGELSVVVPADGKARLESEAALAGLFKVRQCSVFTSSLKPPRRFLMAFRRHPAELELSELAIGSDQYRTLMDGFTPSQSLDEPNVVEDYHTLLTT